MRQSFVLTKVSKKDNGPYLIDHDKLGVATMKNALILHGKDGHSKENWFDWLKVELEKKGWNVWVPNLPQADKPSIDLIREFVLDGEKWQLNQESIIVGHSSGAVAALGIIEALPDDIRVDSCYLVGAFKDDLNWDELKDLFVKPFDFAKIAKKASRFVLIHSDDDPYCPLDHAKFLANKLSGELIVKKGQKHFSVGTYGEEYKEFPFLLELIEDNN